MSICRLSLCLLSIAVSCVVQAQIPQRSTELFFTVGTIVGKRMAAVTDQFEYRIPLRSTGGVLINRGTVQFGAIMEFGTQTAVHWYMAPSLTGNFRVFGKRGYGYAGVTAGYFYSEDGGYNFNRAFRVATGYQSGVQLGYVREIGSGFGLNAELAIRNIRSYRREQDRVPAATPPYYTIVPGEKVAFDAFQMPVMIGIRYRLGASDN